MTLNLYPWSALPVNPTEQQLISSTWLNNVQRSTENPANPWLYNWEIGNSSDLGREPRGSSDSIPNDILDLLPSDPFGMDLEATFTAVAGWFEDFETTSEDSVIDGDEAYIGDYQLVAEFDFLWNMGLLYWPEPNERFQGRMEDKEIGDGAFDGVLSPLGDIEGILSLQEEDTRSALLPSQTRKQQSESCLADVEGIPHDAMEFVINYLDLPELLSVERVCRTMRDWVRRDGSLWTNIFVNQPLSERLTDDALVSLTSRALRNLTCLSLVCCAGITDDGLRIVLQSNPALTKLSVPGCTRLSVEGLVNTLKAFNSSCVPGIKCLRIGELYGMTVGHFEELKLLLGANNFGGRQSIIPRKPRFYQSRHYNLRSEGEFGAIDIDVCSGCGNPKLLYDCPVVGCRANSPSSQGCRACTFCIKRCNICGVCINNDSEYQEDFSFEMVCASCWEEKLPFSGPTHACTTMG